MKTIRLIWYSVLEAFILAVAVVVLFVFAGVIGEWCGCSPLYILGGAVAVGVVGRLIIR